MGCFSHFFAFVIKQIFTSFYIKPAPSRPARGPQMVCFKLQVFENIKIRVLFEPIDDKNLKTEPFRCWAQLDLVQVVGNEIRQNELEYILYFL